MDNISLIENDAEKQVVGKNRNSEIQMTNSFCARRSEVEMDDSEVNTTLISLIVEHKEIYLFCCVLGIVPIEQINKSSNKSIYFKNIASTWSVLLYCGFIFSIIPTLGYMFSYCWLGVTDAMKFLELVNWFK